MRMINIQKDGEDYIAPPQTVQVENKIEQPISQPTVQPEKPQSNKKALLYLLFIPLLFGAVWLGQFAVSKTNKYFMNKRDEIIEDKINEKIEEKKEKQKEEKKDEEVNIYTSFMYPTDSEEQIAVVIPNTSRKYFLGTVEDYSFFNLRFEYYGNNIYISTAEFFQLSDIENLENQTLNPNRIEKLDNNFYLIDYTYKEETDFWLFYKLGEEVNETNQNSIWYGVSFLSGKTYQRWNKEQAKNVYKIVKDNLNIYTYFDPKNAKDMNGIKTDISSYTNIDTLIEEKMEESGIVIKDGTGHYNSIYSTAEGVTYTSDIEGYGHCSVREVEKDNINSDNKKFSINGYEAIVTLDEKATVMNKYEIYVYKDNKIYYFDQAGPTKDETINDFVNAFSK